MTAIVTILSVLVCFHFISEVYFIKGIKREQQQKAIRHKKKRNQ